MKITYEKFAEVIPGLLLAIGLTALVFLALLCGGCTRKVYVPVESVRTEYKDRVQLQTRFDSVFQRDSVAVLIKGDTVKIERWRDRIKYRDREVHDTIISIKTDSVSVPYPVEKELSKWEKTKMDAGGFAIVTAIALFIALCIAVVWLIKKGRR